ncbi:hypothetical protein C2I36_09520 [Rhodobacteraceae bacterium WD3A24]|nr:hypothetical protein C2I36_09520 [Rhodobacteraceae bacterium WD3A24]
MRDEQSTGGRLRRILQSGYVRRWHTHPRLSASGETVAHHSAMAAQIILALHPDPPLGLIAHMLHHDCGEAVTGDVPGPVRREHDGIDLAVGDLEMKALAEMGADYTVSGEDAAWSEFADRLSKIVHVATVAPDLLYTDAWQQEWTAAVHDAYGLGVADELAGLLDNRRAG